MSKIAKRKNRQLGNKENFFVLTVLLVLLSIALGSFLTIKNLSLYCFPSNGLIECKWENCQLKTEGAEMVIAKIPDYTETVQVTEKSGSSVFSPSPLAGSYIVLLSCKNGETVQRIDIS